MSRFKKDYTYQMPTILWEERQFEVEIHCACATFRGRLQQLEEVKKKTEIPQRIQLIEYEQMYIQAAIDNLMATSKLMKEYPIV